MVGFGFSLFAQSGKLSEDKRKEFEAQKVAFFTQEMDLTPEEATKFWPLYNEMQQKIRVENDKIRDLTCRKDKKEVPEVTEQQALKNLEIMLSAEQAVRDIKKEYIEKFANPYVAASKGFIDSVIEPKETRSLLLHALKLSVLKEEYRPAKKHGLPPF